MTYRLTYTFITNNELIGEVSQQEVFQEYEEAKLHYDFMVEHDDRYKKVRLVENKS